ncbi:MAG: arylamine N-acetyltransferase [Anaerolineae bacterium]|nr:arylamine N-acetyltransferase [Anaerolineae bacterium]
MDTKPILQYLGVEPAAPDLSLLEKLIAAYVRRVPWESASRIAARYGGWETYPRWPEVFWRQAQLYGTGGTCFESNGAFLALLRELGYEGYRTINNMGATVGCHTALIILLDGQKWLVDAGLPLYTPLPIDPGAITTRECDLMHYTVRPVGADHYEIERDPHPNRIAFTLIDKPVDARAYHQATTVDYEPGGYFLDRVVINKVIDEQVWRFSSGERPYHLETFVDNQRVDYPLPDDPAAAVAQKFGMEQEIIAAALAALMKG